MKVKEYYTAMQEMGITYEQAIGAVKEFAETASTIRDFGIGGWANGINSETRRGAQNSDLTIQD